MKTFQEQRSMIELDGTDKGPITITGCRFTGREALQLDKFAQRAVGVSALVWAVAQLLQVFL